MLPVPLQGLLDWSCAGSGRGACRVGNASEAGMCWRCCPSRQAHALSPLRIGGTPSRRHKNHMQIVACLCSCPACHAWCGGAAANFFGKSTKIAIFRRDKSLRPRPSTRSLPAATLLELEIWRMLHRLDSDTLGIPQKLKRELSGAERSARRAVQSGGN